MQRDAVIARAGVALPLMRLACWGKRSRPLGCQETVAFWLLGGVLWAVLLSTHVRRCKSFGAMALAELMRSCLRPAPRT